MAVAADVAFNIFVEKCLSIVSHGLITTMIELKID